MLFLYICIMKLHSVTRTSYPDGSEVKYLYGMKPPEPAVITREDIELLTELKKAKINKLIKEKNWRYGSV